MNDRGETRYPHSRALEPSRPPAALKPVPAQGDTRPTDRGLATGTAIVVCVLLPLLAAASLELGGRPPVADFYTVAKSDLPLVVTAWGTLESQRETKIICEVYTTSSWRDPGIRILHIVPNGKAVKKGDLLVSLDEAPLRERIAKEFIHYTQVRASVIRAHARYDNQRSRNKTALENAKLDVRLAELALQMYRDDRHGTYRIELMDLDLQMREALNQMREALAGLAMQRTNRRGMELLYKLGYRGRRDRDQAVYEHLQTQNALVSASNALSNLQARRAKLVSYDRLMKTKQLEGDLITARLALVQVQRDNEARLADAKADMVAADRHLARHAERLERYRSQLANCQIRAPHDGMAVYATGWSWWGQIKIGEGQSVRHMQHILSLPDLTAMQVKAKVHESALRLIRPGQPATIRVDAFPNRLYRGVVKSVAVLPDPGGWLRSDIRVYDAAVTIDGEVRDLQPGMTAVVDIDAGRLHDVLAVPAEAVVDIDGAHYCLVKAERGLEQRPVKLGNGNDNFIEIRHGLAAGEQVVRDPLLLLEQAAPQWRRIGPDWPLANQPDRITVRKSWFALSPFTAHRFLDRPRTPRTQDSRNESTAGLPANARHILELQTRSPIRFPQGRFPASGPSYGRRHAPPQLGTAGSRSERLPAA